MTSLNTDVLLAVSWATGMSCRVPQAGQIRSSTT
jgi:hypothetical protein